MQSVDLQLIHTVPSDPISAVVNQTGKNVAGSLFTLTCIISETVSGLSAMPTARWLDMARNNSELAVGNDVAVVSSLPSEEMATAVLTFNPLKASHGRNFTCSGDIATPAAERPIVVMVVKEVEVQSKCGLFFFM